MYVCTYVPENVLKMMSNFWGFVFVMQDFHRRPKKKFWPS